MLYFVTQALKNDGDQLVGAHEPGFFFLSFFLSFFLLSASWLLSTRTSAALQGC
jgi:hypothetical protein